VKPYNNDDRVSNEYLSVNCCGCQHLFGYNTGSSRPGGRRDFNILYITEGTCFIREGEHEPETAVPAGSVILYLPGEPQFYRFSAEIRSTSYFIHFSGTGCSELLRRAEMLGKRVFDIGDSATLQGIYSRLIDDFYRSAPMHEELSAAYLMQLIALIGRKLQNQKTGLSVQQNNRIEDICRAMHRDYKKDRALSEYAAACTLSESRFSHLFKESTGVSPHRYLLNLRLTKARELLENTDLSIAQICREVGIADQNYFSRVFKKLHGCSPSAYRHMD
jgi:AraC-like DNA-binding protein